MSITFLCNQCGRPLPAGHTGRRTCARRERDRYRRRYLDYPTRMRASPAWQRLRAIVRRRDGGCVLRERGDCEGALAVHHLLALAEGDDNPLSNLVTVCRRHHEQLETRFFRSESALP